MIVQQILLIIFKENVWRSVWKNWSLDIRHLTSPLQDEVKVFITASKISHLLEDPGYPSGVDPFRQPSDLSWSYAAIAVSSRKSSFPRNLGNSFCVTRQKQLRWRLGVPTIYMGKPEIPVGKSNGLHHFVWEVSGNKSCDLKRGIFSTLVSLFNWFEYTLRRSFWQQKVYSFMFMDKISTQVNFV